MDLLNVKKDKKFNWDDIDVGNIYLDHSQKFFAGRHLKHEKMKMDQIEELDSNANVATKDKEPIDISASTLADKENVDTNAVKTEPDDANAVAGAFAVPSIKMKSLNGCDDHGYAAISKNNGEDANTTFKATDTVNENKVTAVEVKQVTKIESPNNTPQPQKRNILVEWSTKKNVQKIDSAIGLGAIPKQSVMPPKAYEYMDIYQQKRHEAERKRLEEERILRQFHSRTVPDFKSCHKKLDNRQVIHHITAPVTPATLKTSRLTELKRKKKLDEIQRKQMEVPVIKPNSAAYIHEEPFKPKKAVTVLEQNPFKLRLDQRVKERREYNATVYRTLEEKKKQVDIMEEERKKQEEEQIKTLRKLTTFKARPNPFKPK